MPINFVEIVLPVGDARGSAGIGVGGVVEVGMSVVSGFSVMFATNIFEVTLGATNNEVVLMFPAVGVAGAKPDVDEDPGGSTKPDEVPGGGGGGGGGSGILYGA